MDRPTEPPLERRLIARIRANGPITFAEFMEAALYDPEDGFYAGLPVGPDAHFVTSPHVSGAFADLVARQVGECWELLGKPRPFVVTELGAGDGTLARGILESVQAVPDLSEAIRYSAVERSPGAREALAVAGLDPREALDGPAHVVIANELLDNLPFHRLRMRGGHVVEVLVGAEGDRLVEVEAEPFRHVLAVLSSSGHPQGGSATEERADLAEGEERPVSPAALSLVEDVAKALSPGYAFFFDYGFVAGEGAGPVHAYRDHRVTTDVLTDPGSRDVTAAVDLAAVVTEAERLGLTAWGPVTQREALLALGMRTWMGALRRRRREAEDRDDARLAARLYSERSRASILIDEEKLGALKLLALGSEGLPAPAAVLGDRESAC